MRPLSRRPATRLCAALALGLWFGACSDDSNGTADGETVDGGSLDVAVAPPDASRPVDGALDAGRDRAPPDAAVDRSEDFYEPDTVQQIDLEISAADQAAMLAALPERIYVPATFRWRDQTLERVGVRFKGDSSSSPNAQHKRSYLIKFGEFVDGQRFLGLRRVALDNAVQFGSLFSERFIDDVLRAEGVIISRSNYARVAINGKYHGLRVNVERIDKSYLERYFGNRDGILYKVHHGGPGAVLEVLPAAMDYAQTYEAQTHEDEADFTDLKAFATLLRDTPDAQLAEALEARFELDPFLRMMAVFMLAGAFDQYTGWGPHNFYLYDDPATGRWSYLAWDLDVGFADNAFGRVRVIDDWNASWPLPQRPRPLTERILNDPGLRARYRAYAAAYVERYFEPGLVAARFDALYALIRDDLVDDPYPARRITNPDVVGWDAILDSLKAFSQRRYQTALAELADPLTEPPGYAPVQPPPNRDPMPGPPSEDAPSDLRATDVRAGQVALEWTDNAVGEAIHIIQRCTGAGCEGFANHVGIPGENVGRGVDPGARAGATYRYRVYAARPTPQGPAGTGVSNAIEVDVP